MQKKRLLYGGIAVVIVIALIAGAGYVGFRRIPSVAAQVSAASQISIRIIDPPAESSYPADAAIPISAIAQSLQPIAELEYWVDGVQTWTEPPAAGNSPTFVYQTWKWMPIVEGDHTVTFRAMDSQGHLATSNVLRIHADPAAGYRILHPTTPDDTWEGLTDECSTSLDAIAQANSQLDPQQPLPPNTQVWIPCKPIIPTLPKVDQPAPPPVPQANPITSLAPNKIGMWVNSNIYKLGTLLPAPVLSAGLENCLVRLSVQDASTAEEGFMVYRSGVNDFERIATLGPNSSTAFTYDDPLNSSGQVQYYVSAYNPAGESQSNIVSVPVPAGSCGPAVNPLVKYENGALMVGNGMDLAYVYASLDKADWQRLPEGENFFTPQNGRVDLLQYLNPLLKMKPFARQVDLQVWGWSGGEIQDLGPLTITFDRSSLLFCDYTEGGCIGDVGSTYWSDQGGLVSSNSPTDSPWRDMQFITNSLNIPYGLVQISTSPFPAEYQPNPPYLVDQYLVPLTMLTSVSRADFKIDFGNLKVPQSTTFSPNFIYPQTAWWNLLNSSGNTSLSPFAQSLMQQMYQSSVFPPGMFDAMTTTTYYIRVIPWDVSKPVGTMSNTIAVTYKPTKQTTMQVITQQPPLFSIQITGFTPEGQIDPPLFGCVTVTGLDEAKYRAWLQANYVSQMEPLDNWYSNMGFNISPFMDANGNPVDEETWIQQRIAEVQNAIATQAVICPDLYVPSDDDSGFWNDLWDAISSSWNAIVDLYNTLKNGIVEVFASILNGIYPGICDTTCKSGLMMGLNVAITYFTGIPPNLPTTDELVDKGLDVAIDAALNEAGIDFCDDFCRGQLRDGIKAAADQLKQKNSQPACFGGSNTAWYGKRPMCLPDGYITEPIPGGAYTPPNVQVNITRNNQVIIGSAEQYDFSLQVTSTLVNPAPVGQDYYCPGNGFSYVGGQFQLGYWIVPVPDVPSGSVYTDETIPLPGDLAPGTTFDLPIMLKAPKTPIYLYPAYQALIGQPKGFSNEENARHCSYRLLTSPGYTITLNAQLMCTSKTTGETIPCPPSEIAITGDTKQFTP